MDRPKIDLIEDHYSVQFLSGWVYAKDHWFRAVLSKKSKMVAVIAGEAAFFDTGPEKYFSYILDHHDLTRRTSRFWGAEKVLFKSLPADADASLNLRLLVHREERLAAVLKGLEEAEPAGLNLGHWVGYTLAVTEILNSLAEATRVDVPFEWTGDIQVRDLVSDGKMYEHYLILIAQRDDRDELDYDPELLSYEHPRLLYDGQPIVENCWTVLRVYRAPGPDIIQMMFESKAPWAVVGSRIRKTNFYDLENNRQLGIRLQSIIDQLETQLALLKEEHRFSAYGRALAVYHQALVVQRLAASFCQTNGIPARDCADRRLVDYMAQVGSRFNFSGEVEADLVADATFMLGLALFEEGRYQEAAVCFEDVAAERKEDNEALSALGWALYKTGEYGEAEEALRQALEITKVSFGGMHPTTTATMRSLAAVYDAAGKSEEALQMRARAAFFEAHSTDGSSAVEVFGPEVAFDVDSETLWGAIEELAVAAEEGEQVTGEDRAAEMEGHDPPEGEKPPFQ